MPIPVLRVTALLTVLAGALQEPAEARCRRAGLEAARAAESKLSYREPSAAEIAPSERELGAEGEPESTSTPRSSGVRIAAIAPPAPESAEPRPARGSSGSAPPFALPRFTVNPGETLRGVLTRWADASGWQVVWEASNDYSLSAPASFPSDFREATTRLMESLQSNGAPFGAELYNANRVVRVTRVR
jgi:hypothetical protein